MLAPTSVRSTTKDCSPDTELVAGLLEGDQRALRSAYDLYAGVVYGLARRVTASATTADDITQEVFLHLWEHPDAVDLSRGSLRSYLGVVAHHRAVDAIRRTTRTRQREERAGLDADLSATSHEVEVVEADFQADRTSRLRQAVSSLPTDQRQALELAYFGDCTYREVATRLGIPEGTAKSRMRLALARLRDLIEPPERMAPA